MESSTVSLTRPERRTPSGARTRQRERSDALLEFGNAAALPQLIGLDGLRGVAVLGVVVFHGGFGLLPGGYLGVSLFFTLSGFLITSLLVNELRRTEAVDFRAFWARRFRRLIPAAWLTLVGIGVAAVLLDDVRPDLRGDLWAAAANVANWRFLTSGSSYADLFTSSSPVLHFWSLAIEEQFYLVFPMLFVGVWRLCRARSAAVTLVLGLAATVSFMLPILGEWSVDRTYYGTDARAGELLVGSVLALTLSLPSVRRALVRRWWWRTAAATLGVAAAFVTLILWVTASDGDQRLTSGLLIVVALSSASLILGAAVPSGPLHRLAATQGLRWLGRVSYAVYLFHWPVLVWSGATEPGPGHLVRFLVAMTAVLVLAEASHRWFEMPLRRRSVPTAVLRPVSAIAVVAVIAGPVLLTSRVNAAQEVVAGLDDAANRFSAPRPSGDDAVAVLPAVTERLPNVALTVPPNAGAGPLPTSIPPLPSIAEPPVVSFFGDSIALSLAMTLGYWNADGSKFVDGRGITMLGCGVLPGGSMRYDRVRPMPSECDEWSNSWPGVVRLTGTDVAVVHSCQWETIERRYPGMEQFVAPGDPAADATITEGYLAAVDLLIGAGADLVVWVDCPRFSLVTGTRRIASGLRESRDPSRVARLNELIRGVAAQRDGMVAVMPWSEIVNARVDDETLRPDGSHYQWKADVGVGAEFGTALLELIDRVRTS